MRFVMDKEECFSHNIPYEGDTVRVSFVVIKADVSWHYGDEGVDLQVCTSILANNSDSDSDFILFCACLCCVHSPPLVGRDIYGYMFMND